MVIGLIDFFTVAVSVEGVRRKKKKNASDRTSYFQTDLREAVLRGVRKQLNIARNAVWEVTTI